jgi:hypothetical protein
MSMDGMRARPWRRLGKPLPRRQAEALRAVERSLAAAGDGV